MKKPPFPVIYKNVGIAGLGLIGGSLARALKRAFPKINIFAADRSKEALLYAFEQGFIDMGHQDFSVLRDCEIVFVATDVDSVSGVIKEVFSVTGDSAIITDTASVKGSIEQGLPEGIRFVGGHPMAGSEKGGVRHSREELFENALYFLTKHEGTPAEDFESVRALVLATGAIPAETDSVSHDKIVAAVSHLPHMAAFALASAAVKDGNYARAAAGGFKDMTRVAASNPDFWANVARLNRAELLKSVDEYKRELDKVAAMMRDEEYPALSAYFKAAGEKRNSVDASVTAFDINVELPDRAGEIARVADILGKKNINIKNLAILNSREGFCGALQVTFADKESAERACGVLRAKKYRVTDTNMR